MDLHERLKSFIDKHGMRHWSFAAKRDESFVQSVFEKTENLPADTPFPVRVYAAVYGDEFCALGKLKKLKSITDGWSFCGRANTCPCAKSHISTATKAALAKKTPDEWRKRSEKTKVTVESKYNVDNVGKLEKAREAHASFYADEFNVKNAQSKGRETMMRLYGVDNALKLPTIDRQHRRNHIEPESLAILDDPARLADLAARMSSVSIARHLGIDVTTVNNYLRRYGVNCRGSSYEREISAFLDDLGVRHIPRYRKLIGLEVDFYLPDRSLAIEFNGLYYHTTRVVDKHYHRTKHALCEEKGVRLLMFNEDELVNRPAAVYGKIKHLLGMAEPGVGARKLEIRQIANAAALAFVDRHHIQGKPSMCKIAVGAFHDNELVAVLTIAPQRGTRQNEINRFCTNGRTYPGAFSRLLKAARQIIPGPLITFADLRYSDGGLYEGTGFVLVERIRPDYRYVYRGETFHKSLFTKTRIKKRFGIDMDHMTEREAMEMLGYERIYDCGKIKYQIN